MLIFANYSLFFFTGYRKLDVSFRENYDKKISFTVSELSKKHYLCITLPKNKRI